MNTQTCTRSSTPIRQAYHRQEGVILFITLIALAVLMIASVALVRNVDTATMISGNLAFKQSATASGDSGVRVAMAALMAKQAANALDADDPGNGYHATINAPAGSLARGGATWTGGSSNLGAADAAGNRTRYIIQRMSNTLGACTPATCLYNTVFEDDGTHGVGPEPPPKFGKKNYVLYRITVEVQGPKNTTSYVQIFAD